MPARVFYADRALTPLETIRNTAILVEGSKIPAVGRRGELPLPPRAQEYSARGMSVVPGFVDASCSMRT